jgi:hypothetical protein
MLTSNRQTIIAYEATYGVDPDSSAAAMLGNSIAAANSSYDLTGSAAVQTLTQIFDPAERSFLSMLESETLSPLLIGLSIDFATPTNVFVASGSDLGINAGLGDRTISSTGEQLSSQLASVDLGEASANHILVGTGDGQTLIGGLCVDVLVAGSGSETLTSGLGDDTIVAGAGAEKNH